MSDQKSQSQSDISNELIFEFENSDGTRSVERVDIRDGWLVAGLSSGNSGSSSSSGSSGSGPGNGSGNGTEYTNPPCKGSPQQCGSGKD